MTDFISWTISYFQELLCSAGSAKHEPLAYLKDAAHAVTTSLYHPIQSSEIRLLEILPPQQPGTLTESIRARLHTFQVEDCPRYIALSYEWGNATDTEIITINGVPAVSIRANLHTFLLLLRDQLYARSPPSFADSTGGGPCYFWADAICINQVDHGEKNHQVQRMHQIYEKAAHMVAWVWRFDVNPARWVQSRHIDEDSPRSPAEIARASLAFLTAPRWSAALGTGSKKPLFHLEDLGSLRYLTGLLCFPTYWSRRWIAQELVLSKQITLMFGTVQIPLEVVELFFQALLVDEDHERSFVEYSRHSQPPEDYEDKHDIEDFVECLQQCGAAQACRLRAMRLRWRNPAPRLFPRIGILSRPPRTALRWDECLKMFRNFECDCSLDVVYAVQNMVRVEDRITPDYGLPPSQLIKSIYEILRNQNTSQKRMAVDNSFLYARLLASRMYKDIDGELERTFKTTLATKSKVEAALDIKVIARFRGFVKGHIPLGDLSMGNMWENLFSGNLKRPPPPIPTRGYPAYGPAGRIPTEMLEGLYDEAFDQTMCDVDDVVSDEDSSLAGNELDQLERVDSAPGWISSSLLEGQMESALSRSFWSLPQRGPVLWERRLIKSRKDGVYRPVPGVATEKHRDISWNMNADNRIFVARRSGSLSGAKIYGVSEFPVQPLDEIWQIPGMEIAIIMRKAGNSESRIVSCAYLYQPSIRAQMTSMELPLDKDCITEEALKWNCPALGWNRGKKRTIELDLPLLLELSR